MIFSLRRNQSWSQARACAEIPLSELHPFEGHPFRVVDDEDMMKTVESVREYGVLPSCHCSPWPVWWRLRKLSPVARRHHASELAGKETMPAIVRDMDDDIICWWTLICKSYSAEWTSICVQDEAGCYQTSRSKGHSLTSDRWSKLTATTNSSR